MLQVDVLGAREVGAQDVVVILKDCVSLGFLVREGEALVLEGGDVAFPFPMARLQVKFFCVCIPLVQEADA